MDHKEILSGLLATAYKMPSEQITELLNKTDGSEALTAIIEADKERVSGLTTKKFQDGYKKGKSESLKDHEKGLREKYQIADELQGEALIDKIIAEKVTAATKEAGGGKPKELTEDDVKRHKVYQDALAAARTQMEAKEAEWKSKLDEQQKAFTKQQTFGSVKEKALNLLNPEKFVLPTDAQIAANQKSWFLRDLEGYEYEKQDDRTIVLKDGKVVEDGHGHPVAYDDFINSRAAAFFEKKANNGGSNAGNSNEGEGGAAGNNGAKPANIEDLTRMMNDQSISVEKRREILKQYKETQAAQ